MARPTEPKLETVMLDGLHPVGRRPPLLTYVAQLWDRRHFIVADSQARVSSGTRQLILGNAWLVIKPLLDAILYLLVFGWLLQTDRGVENFIGYLVIGVFMFGFTARCLNSGASSVVSGRNLTRSFTFPRVSLPIATVLRETLNTIPGLITMMAIVVLWPPHAEVTWRWALFPAVFGLQILFNLGIAMIASRLVARVKDLINLISFFTRFWLYGSAVFFSYDAFVDHPTILELLEINPMFQVLDISRDVLLYGQTPEVRAWCVLGAWSLGVLVIGFIVFWRGEENYGRD